MIPPCTPISDKRGTRNASGGTTQRLSHDPEYCVVWICFLRDPPFPHTKAE